MRDAAVQLGNFFQAVVNGLEVAHGKPAPDIFLAAAAKLGLPPAACVVVEDAPVGIEAARAAGMAAIGYVGTHPPERLRAAGAARVVARLTEVTPQVVVGLIRGR